MKKFFTEGRPPWYDETGSIKSPLVIGVAGGSASGKTTVCSKIVERVGLEWVSLISMDSYYRGLTPEETKDPGSYNFDHPDAFDMDLLIQTISDLKGGKKVTIPIYDFKTNARKENGYNHIYGADCVVVEGIYVLYDERLRNTFDIKLFVDTEDDIRLARRLKRDILERGRDVRGVLAQYERFVKPAFDDYISPTKRFADVIIPRGSDNEVAINLIAAHVKTKLLERGWTPPMNPSTLLLTTVPPNVHLLPQTPQISFMATIIRDARTGRDDFIFYSDRLARLLVDFSLNFLPHVPIEVTTPVGVTYKGYRTTDKVVGLAIMRSGDALIPALKAVLKDIPTGCVLISNDGFTHKLFFYRIPSDLKGNCVLLLDPMCGTGNTVMMAIRWVFFFSPSPLTGFPSSRVGVFCSSSPCAELVIP
eukprot:TRINITY_DN938_c0_g1_i8.p1 TRINITY_DN938_c0_g1~~TRINITY_DN938_c0_g1_i8.p1  ORF type:complete len:420 (+),score=79.27 TRINITY_DN938_c0_g1_i8:70-1329(+)